MALSRIIWMLCLIGASLFFVFSDSYSALVIVMMTIGLPLVAILINQLTARKLGLKISLSEISQKNAGISATLSVKKRSIFPLMWVECTLQCKNTFTDEVSSAKIMFSVAGKKACVVPFALKSTHCGALEFTVARCRVYDIFGLFFTKPRNKALTETLVLPDTFAPRISVVPNLSKDVEADEYSPDKPGTDVSETFAIREYRPGDNLKQIHWKLTGKFDNLMVREPGLPVSHSFLVLLETSRMPGTKPDPNAFGVLGEIMVSVCQALSDNEIDYEIAWQDHSDNAFFINRVSGMDELSGYIGKMLHACEREGEQNAFLAFSESQGISSFEHVVYISRYLPPGLEAFVGDGRATALVCSSESEEESYWEDNVTVHYCTPKDYETRLSSLAI